MKTIPRFMHIPISKPNSFSHYSNKTFKSQPTSMVQLTQIPRNKQTESISSKLLSLFDSGIVKFLDPAIDLSVDPRHTLTDNFAPVDELSPTECQVISGSLPPCLDGVYIRNGPNPQFIPNGPQHYIDGDGMVHSIRISNGRATFCSRYIKTNKYNSENKLSSSIVPNFIGGMKGIVPFIARAILFTTRIVLGQYDISKGIGVANTNLAFFGGRLYALCESDLPYTLKVEEDGDIVTLGQHDFKGKLNINMTAHPKVDPETKEAFAFRYWATYPYMTYFHFDANGNKQTNVPIFSMREPSLSHDMAITKKYAIILDIQLGAHPMNLIRRGSLVSVDKTKVPRIGVLPRYAKVESEIKWFEVPGVNILHAVNAWDETDEYGNDSLVLVAPNILSVEHFLDRMDLIQASMEKVTIQVGTGVVSRQTLSSDNLEFPVINPAYSAKKNRFVYAAIFEKTPKKSRMIRTIGVAKLDIEGNKEPHECTVASRIYGPNCFGGEPFFIARDANLEEDDGYLVSYVHDESLGESRFLVMDARSPNLDVVADVKLPQRVPYGLHGLFIKEKDLSAM